MASDFYFGQPKINCYFIKTLWVTVFKLYLIHLQSLLLHLEYYLSLSISELITMVFFFLSFCCSDIHIV